MALRPARRRRSARRSSRLGTMLAEEISQAGPRGSKRISKPLRVINPVGLFQLPIAATITRHPSRRGAAIRFSEILALKSLRKGWENETEQWQILIEFRLPKLTPETRTHRARRGLRQSGGGKSLSQSTRPDHSYRSDLLIGETIVSLSRFFISERHQCSRRPNSVLPSGRFCSRKKTRP